MYVKIYAKFVQMSIVPDSIESFFIVQTRSINGTFCSMKNGCILYEQIMLILLHYDLSIQTESHDKIIFSSPSIHFQCV